MALSSDATLAASGALTIASNAVGTAEIDFIKSSTATAGRLLVADGTTFGSVAMSGSCTLAASGAITCPGTGVTALVDLSDVASSTATAGRLLVADGNQFGSVALGGDATLGSTGTLTIASDAVGTAEVDFVKSSTATAGRILGPTEPTSRVWR